MLDNDRLLDHAWAGINALSERDYKKEWFVSFDRLGLKWDKLVLHALQPLAVQMWQGKLLKQIQDEVTKINFWSTFIYEQTISVIMFKKSKYKASLCNDHLSGWSKAALIYLFKTKIDQMSLSEEEKMKNLNYVQ